MPKPIRLHPPTDPTGDLWPQPVPASTLDVSNHGVLVDGRVVPWPLHGEPIAIRYVPAPKGETWAIAYLPVILNSETGTAGPIIAGPGVHVELDTDDAGVRYFIGVTDAGHKLSCRIDGPITAAPARPFPASAAVGAIGLAEGNSPLLYPVSAEVYQEWNGDDDCCDFPCTGQCDPDGAGAGECDCQLGATAEAR